MGYITTGYILVVSDYEGEDAAYGVGQQSGYEKLDAIRAAEKLLGVPERSPRRWGCSATPTVPSADFASEVAPTYAPHLDIVGAG